MTYKEDRERYNRLTNAYNAGRRAAEEDIRQGIVNAEAAQERHGKTLEERREVNAGYWFTMNATDDKYFF